MLLSLALPLRWAAAQSPVSAHAPQQIAAVAPGVGVLADPDADWTQQQDLPLRWSAPEELEALSSRANAAALADRNPGGAGEEEESAEASRGTAADGAAASGLSYDGLPVLLNDSTLDGLSTRQSFRSGPQGAAAGGARGGSSYSANELRSFRVLTGGRGAALLEMFSAQNGGAGGNVRANTMAGSQHLRGSAEWITEESALAATNPYSIANTYSNGAPASEFVKPQGVMNLLSAGAGFPLVLRWLPPRMQRSATLFASADAQFNRDSIVSSPADPQFFALTAEQMALLGTRGVSAAATTGALDYLGSLTGTTHRSAYRLSGLLRADADLSARDHLTLAYTAKRVDAVAGAALGQASDAVVARGIGSLGDSFVNVEAGSALWLRRFSPRIENEARGQAAHDLEYESARRPAAQEPAIGPGGFAPQVSIAPLGFAYGTPSNLGRTAYPDEMRWQLADTLRWSVRHHLLSFGGDWSRIHDRIASIEAEEGAFLYDSGVTNGKDGGLVDWITDFTFNVNAYPNGGCPSITAAVHEFCFRTYTQGFGAQQTEFVMHEFAGFVEDAFAPRRDLKLTFGARFDYILLPLPQQSNSVLDSDLALAGVAAATGRFPEDRNNFAPRLAAAWSPSWLRGTTLQAGYGVFFAHVPGGIVRAALADTAMPATNEHIRITPATVTQCPQVTNVSQGFGYPCAFVTTPPAAVAQTTSATVFAKSFRSPQVQRGEFAIEHAFSALRMRASYALAYAVQLPATTDVNIAPSPGYVQYVLQGGDATREHFPGLHTGETFAVPLYTSRRILQYGPVTEMESNANAYSNAGTLEAEWRRRAMFVRGSYTFSRAIDDGPLQSATPSLDSQFDPYANGYDKGLSSLNFPQRFAGAAEYESSWRHGSRHERRALSGWRVSAIGTAGSGAPYSYTIFGGTYLSGGRETINGSGGATYLPTVGRNTLRLPPRGKLDLRLGRAFDAGARVRLNVFAEAFNLLNERNIMSVQTRAFLPGNPTAIGGATGLTPLVFQDAAAIASEGLTTLPFGSPARLQVASAASAACSSE